MITPDRIEELKIVADWSGNLELSELLDAYLELAEFREVADMSPSELAEYLSDLEVNSRELAARKRVNK